MIDKELLDIIACPKCKKDLILEKNNLICNNCKRNYNIKEGIPILLDKESFS